MIQFVDRVVLHVAAGDGGNGAASIHREKFKPLGGPDGGNGGRGGDVILVVDAQVTTLLDYHHSPHRRAGAGAMGRGSNRNGSDGGDLILPVPDGTVVATPEGAVVMDLVGHGTSFVIAAGGRGGLGNAALASSRRKAPGFALLGEPGWTGDVVLELKTVADVALVGFPSAGKSSLVAAMSAARPAIADYPFTTLTPNLGVVQADDERFVVADVPGLIEGASEGRGLGLQFLRHVERCSVLVHVLDCGTLEPGRDPLSDLDVILNELSRYAPAVGVSGGVDLTDRPAIIALNKIDMTDARELADLVTPSLTERGYEVYPISAATREGIRELTFAMSRLVVSARAVNAPVGAPRVVIRPPARDDSGFRLIREAAPVETAQVGTTREDGTEPARWRVVGERPERWIRQTDFTNDEAVGYLGDRLARLGVEQALVRAGAHPDDEVLVGTGPDAVVFDWDPDLATGPAAGVMANRRGEDLRVTTVDRANRTEKRIENDERREARRLARAELEADRAAGRWTDPGES